MEEWPSGYGARLESAWEQSLAGSSPVSSAQQMLTFKKTWWIMVLGAISCFINIDKTYLLIEDTARDSVRMIQIWQGKELTLIGPPASLGQRSTREFYLGSLSYYLGIFGLFVTDFQVWGAIIGQVLIFVSSIPILYLVLRDHLKVKYPLLGTLIYAISPLTLTHMRFYWNPNAIIGFSTWFWYFILKKEAKISLIISGILLGIIFNFHYFAAIPLFIYLIYLVFQRKFKSFGYSFFGVIIGLSPTWIFEIRNHFYLTKTFWFNLQNNTSSAFNLTSVFESLYRFPLAILGIKPMEIGFSVITSNALQIILGIIFIISVVFCLKKLQKNERFFVILAIISSIIVGLISNGSYYGRYLFGLYPIFIFVIMKAFEKVRWVWIILMAFILIADYKIISFRPSPEINYINIDTLSKASFLIKSDVKNETYNLSENIYGDAQARGLRYFVLKNVAKKPENDISYEHLDVLYVLTPSLEKTIKDHRYEFYVSNLTKVDWEENLGEVKLIKFIRK